MLTLCVASRYLAPGRGPARRSVYGGSGAGVGGVRRRARGRAVGRPRGRGLGARLPPGGRARVHVSVLNHAPHGQRRGRLCGALHHLQALHLVSKVRGVVVLVVVLLLLLLLTLRWLPHKAGRQPALLLVPSRGVGLVLHTPVDRVNMAVVQDAVHTRFVLLPTHKLPRASSRLHDVRHAPVLILKAVDCVQDLPLEVVAGEVAVPVGARVARHTRGRRSGDGDERGRLLVRSSCAPRRRIACVLSFLQGSETWI